MADNYLTKLVNQVSAVAPTTDALANAVIFNTSWRDADIETSRSFYNKEGRPKVLEDNYFLSVTNEFLNAAQTGTGRSMSETWLGKNIAETVIHNVLTNVKTSSNGDVRSELKRVQGSVFAALVGAVEEGTTGISNEKAKEFAAEVIFKYIYNDESNLDNPSSLIKDEEKIYDTDDYIIQSTKIFRRSQISRDVLAVDRTVEQVRKGIDVLPEVDGLLSKARTEEERSRVIGREAQTESYINRPGVYPFISLLETAKKEIVIDTFQFQNKTISDYLYSVTEKRMLESARSGNWDFELKLRLATPRTVFGAAKDEASHTILGPNMLEMQKFNELRIRVINQLKNEEGITAPVGGWDSWEPIKFEAQDKRHHAKLYFTDAVAAIGTTNLTSPMGDNIQQAGSNFETMRFIHNRLGDTDSETLRRSGTESVDVRETLLYRQVQDLMTRRYAESDDQPGGRSISMNRAGDNRANIGLSGDIFSQLEETLGFASRAENDKTKFYAILDQLMLLQYDTDIYAEAAKGEFGIEDELFQSRAAQSGRHTKFKQVQTQLFDLLLNNRAEVVVDVRNYRDQILNPTLEKLLKDNGTTLDTIRIEAFKKSGRDIGIFVGEGSITEKTARLASYGITDSSQVTQLLAIASGNIRATVVARQHVKSFALFDYADGTARALSTYMGSSNLGPYATSMGLSDDYNVSEEYGLLFSKFGNNKRDGNALTEEQEQEELSISGKHFFITWRQLDTKNIENPNSFKHRKTTTMWEGQVDSEALATFRERLMEFAANTGIDKNGFNIEYGYDGSNGTGQRVTHLIVSMNVDSMSGMGKGYIAGGGAKSNHNIQFEVTTLKGSSRTGGEGLVYFIGQNRLVSNAVFVNTSGQSIPMPFGSDRGSNDPRSRMLPHGETQQMSSMDTAISLFGTLAGEVIYRTVVSNPRQAFENLSFDEQNRAFTDYLNALAPGGVGIDGLLGSDIKSIAKITQLGGVDRDKHRNKVLDQLTKNQGKLIELVTLMETRFSSQDNKYLQIAAKLGGADIDMTTLDNPRVKAVNKLRESLGNLVTLNDDIERAILANDVPLALAKRDEATRLLAGTENGANVSIFSQFRQMMAQAEGDTMGAQFPELALDIISQRQDFLYNSRLKKDLQGAGNTLIESLLTPAQDRTYGGPQASYRTLVFGFDASVRYAQARQRAASTGGGVINKDDIGNLGLYSRMVPYAYGPTTSLGDTYIRSIASKSSITENFEGTAMTFMGLEAMPIGDVMQMEIIEALGMGSITRREHIDLVEARMRSKLALVGMNTTEIEAIIHAMRAKVGVAFGDTINTQTGQIEQAATNTILNFTTGGKEKASQLPQRLKNALGSRPLYALSIEAQKSVDDPRLLAKRLNLSRELQDGLIDQEQYDSYRLGPSINEEEYKVLLSNKNIPNMRQVADKYLGLGEFQEDSKALKTRVAQEIDRQKADLIDRYTSGRLKSKTIFDESMARLERGLLTMVTEDLEVAAVFGGRIRKVLDTAAAEWVEEQRREIEEVLGEGSTRDENSVAGEILRAYAIRADMSSQGQGALIGGSDRGGKKAVVLVQLAGAYSDYAVANPDFGSQYDDNGNLVVHGVNEGAVETSKERVKGSMLAQGSQEITSQLAPTPRPTNKPPKGSRIIGGGYSARFIVNPIVEQTNFTTPPVLNSTDLVNATDSSPDIEILTSPTRTSKYSNKKDKNKNKKNTKSKSSIKTESFASDVVTTANTATTSLGKVGRVYSMGKIGRVYSVGKVGKTYSAVDNNSEELAGVDPLSVTTKSKRTVVPFEKPDRSLHYVDEYLIDSDEYVEDDQEEELHKKYISSDEDNVLDAKQDTSKLINKRGKFTPVPNSSKQRRSLINYDSLIILIEATSDSINGRVFDLGKSYKTAVSLFVRGRRMESGQTALKEAINLVATIDAIIENIDKRLDIVTADYHLYKLRKSYLAQKQLILDSIDRSQGKSTKSVIEGLDPFSGDLQTINTTSYESEQLEDPFRYIPVEENGPRRGFYNTYDPSDPFSFIPKSKTPRIDSLRPRGKRIPTSSKVNYLVETSTVESSIVDYELSRNTVIESARPIGGKAYPRQIKTNEEDLSTDNSVIRSSLLVTPKKVIKYTNAASAQNRRNLINYEQLGILTNNVDQTNLKFSQAIDRFTKGRRQESSQSIKKEALSLLANLEKILTAMEDINNYSQYEQYKFYRTQYNTIKSGLTKAGLLHIQEEAIFDPNLILKSDAAKSNKPNKLPKVVSNIEDLPLVSTDNDYENEYIDNLIQEKVGAEDNNINKSNFIEEVDYVDLVLENSKNKYNRSRKIKRDTKLSQDKYSQKNLASGDIADPPNRVSPSESFIDSLEFKAGALPNRRSVINADKLEQIYLSPQTRAALSKGQANGKVGLNEVDILNKRIETFLSHQTKDIEVIKANNDLPFLPLDDRAIRQQELDFNYAQEVNTKRAGIYKEAIKILDQIDNALVYLNKYPGYDPNGELRVFYSRYKKTIRLALGQHGVNVLEEGTYKSGGRSTYEVTNLLTPSQYDPISPISNINIDSNYVDTDKAYQSENWKQLHSDVESIESQTYNKDIEETKQRIIEIKASIKSAKENALDPSIIAMEEARLSRFETGLAKLEAGESIVNPKGENYVGIGEKETRWNSPDKNGELTGEGLHGDWSTENNIRMTETNIAGATKKGFNPKAIAILEALLIRLKARLARENAEKAARSAGTTSIEEVSSRIIPLTSVLAQSTIRTTYENSTNKSQTIDVSNIDEELASPLKAQGRRSQAEPILYVAMGDDIHWNSEAGRYMVYRDNKPQVDILVSRTKQYSVLGGIIENFQVSDGVSVAKVEAQAYIREGEDSHSILLNVNRKQGGSPETNQMTWNITRIDVVKAGGGRRSESLVGGLLKAVFTFAAGQNVKLNQADEDGVKRSYFESLVWQMNQRKGGSFTGADLELEQVSAIISPSNIKAFYYSHGSVILRDGDMMDNLFKLDNGGSPAKSSQRIAAALLLSFGSDFASGDPARGQGLKMQVWEAALRGELGTYYQSVAAVAALQQRGKTTEAIKVFFKNASFNAVATPYLTAFSADELETALSGKDSNGDFVTKVKALVELDSVDQNKEYINLSDIRQRQSALIVSAIDFYQQFSEGYENKGGVRIATDISFTKGDENNVLKMLATIAGVDKTVLDTIAAGGLNNNKIQEQLQAMMEGLVSRVPILRMRMDWASSGSKDPAGSHPKGNLEFQHTLRPMLMQAEAYKAGGQLENLARVVANVFAAVTSSSSSQFYDLAQDTLPTIVNSQGVRVLKHKNILSEFSRSPFAKARAIGVYGSGSHPEEYRMLQKRYKEIAEASLDKQGNLRKGELLLAMEEPDDVLSNDKVNTLLQELDELNNKLETLSRKYGLEENKAAGSDLAKAVVGAMTHEREVLYIPGMQLQVMPDGNRVLIKSDRGGFMSYLPSGEELNIMGTQFGGYVDQLVKYTEIMLEANSPGTRLAYLLDALARNPQGILMTPEDEAIIGRYVAAAGDMMSELAKSTSGMRAQGGVGGKTRLDGAVTVPVGNFLVPGDSVVMAEAVLAKAGVEIAGSKQAALLEINYALDQIYTNQTQVESERKKGYYQTQEAEANYIVIQEQKLFLQAQREALIEGISEAGTRKLVWGAKKSEEIKAKLLDIKTESDINIRLVRLTELRTEVKGWVDFTQSEQRLFNTSSEPGDSFSNLAVQREMQLWYSNILVLEDSVNESQGNTNRVMTNSQRLLELQRIAVYESNPLMVAGYEIGSKYQSQSETNYQITANLLEGSLRGNMPQASLDFGQVESIGKELTSAKKKERQTEFMLHKVEQALLEFDAAADSITRGLDSNWTQEAIKGIDNLKNGLAELELRLKAGANPLDIARDFHALMASEDTRAVQSAVTFRSAPFGSTEFMTQAVRIQRLAAMNRQAVQSGNMSGMLMLQMDEERNRTATFMAPVSKRTIALGDFDGDSFTTIWNYIVQTQEQIVRKKDLNFKLRQDIKYLEEEKTQLEQELLINSDPATLTELAALNDKITQLEQTYSNREYEIIKDIGKVNDINNEVTSRATSAARKDLAEYMGVDERFFIGKDEQDSKNRAGWADKSADVDVLHSYLEFGRNLFGGIDKQAPNVEKARQGLSALVDIQKTGAELALVTDSDIQNRASIALAAERALPIADRNNDLIKLYEVIESNSEVAKGLAAQVRGFGQREARRALSQGSSLSENLEGAIRESSEGIRDESTKDLALRSFTSELHNQLLGNQATQKLVAQGSGMTMSPSTFDILSYSLGVAGGDILGKTFNSMIGTLYQDAPIITMGHVLTKNEDTQAAVKAHITKLAQEGKLSQEWINNTGGIAGAADYFLDQIKSAQAQAEGLQGFMKDTGQLLRDSIKFKDGQGDMLDKLNVVGEQYRKAVESGDTEGANKLIVDIAKNIGPGPGLLAYMQLDSLVNLKDVAITDDILRTKFDIDSGSDYYTRIETRLKENGIQPGLDKNTINRQVAEYKTRQDLVNLVTAFRFEKSVAAAGSSLSYVSDGWAAKLASGETTEDIDTVKSKYQLTELDPATNRVIKSTPTTQDVAAESTSPSGSALPQNAARTGVRGNAKYREALASFLGTTVYNEVEYDKRVKEFIKDKGSDALLLFDEVFSQTERQTQPIFGTEGERLKNFVSQDSTRRSTAQAVSGQMSEAELLRASTRSGDVMDTFMQLMSQGKLNADSLPMLSNMVMAEFEEDITAGKEVTSRDVVEKLLESRQTGATSDEGKSAASMLNELYKLDSGKNKAGDFAYDIDGKSAGYKSMAEFIDEGVEASYMSQQSRMVEHLIKSSQEQGNQPFNTYEDIADASGYTGAAREKFIERMHSMDIQLGQSYRNRDLSYMPNQHSTISKNSVAGRFSQGAVKFLKNAEVANQMDFFLPLLLTVAGNAIASGSIDEDMFQSFAGSSLIALAYSRQGLSTPGYLGAMASKRSILAAGMGTGFKLRMALNESEGDIGQALVTTATRELVFNTTTAVIAPKITNFISHRILGASPYALDQDRYIASKTAASTLAGAFISAAMGMMISNTVVNLSQNALIPGIGLIDAALMGASERNQRIRESQLEAQEGIGISVFNDEDGQEVEAGVVFDESYFTDEPSEAVRAALESTNISEDGEGNLVVGPMSVGLEA